MTLIRMFSEHMHVIYHFEGFFKHSSFLMFLTALRLMGFRCIFLSQFATAAILKSTDRDKIKLKVT